MSEFFIPRGKNCEYPMHVVGVVNVTDEYVEGYHVNHLPVDGVRCQFKVKNRGEYFTVPFGSGTARFYFKNKTDNCI
jgi:hypothetical protein